MKKVGIVILNYKSYRDTIRLISDLQKQKGDIFLEIVVVDNDSPNESVGEIDKYLSSTEFIYNVYFIKNACNSGYAKGNNVGLQYLEQFNCDYVAILNNDIYFTSDFTFEALVNKYQTLENVGLVAPLQLNIENDIITTQVNIPTFFDDFCLAFYLGRKYNRKRNKYISKGYINSIVEKVDIVPGSFIFVSYNIFKNLSFFDEGTFLFGEERCLAAKIKKSGLFNYIFTDLTYIHAHSKTIKKEVDNIKQMRLLFNSILFFTRIYRKFGLLKAFLLKILYCYSIIELKIINLIK